MLDGGPALWYLNRLKNDMANGILLTGYQAENSGGRKLLEEGKLNIFGNLTKIELDVEQFQLSNHCLLYTSPSPRDLSTSRMPSSA